MEGLDICVVTFDWESNDAVKKFSSFDKTKSISWSVIELTDYCNFNCKWCFANAASIKRPIHMDIGDVAKVLKTLADAGVTQITYSGGEPTLYPHLKKAISLANDLDMVVHINTNGYLFTKNMGLELKEAGLSQIQTNIDSIHPKKHDETRGRIGSFGRAIEALKNARDAGLTCVSQTVLTKENEGDILKILSLARDLGVQRCRVWDMTPSSGCARKNSQLLPGNYLSILQELSDFAYDAGAKNVEVGDPLFKQHIKTKLHISGGYCVSAASLIIYVSTRGDVYYCSTLKHHMYNIFEKISAGEDVGHTHRASVQQFIKQFNAPDRCHGCESESVCNGGCYSRRDFSGTNTDYWCKKCIN